MKNTTTLVKHQNKGNYLNKLKGRKFVPFFIFINMTFEDIIDDFNNGNLDVEKYFNGYRTFFNILEKRGYLHMVDPNANGSEEWQNEYLIWLYHNDKEKFTKFVVNQLSNDITMDENGNIYYETRDMSDLSTLFCSNRNGLDSETIGEILSGDNVWEPFYDTTEDVYSDVVQELTPENDRILQNEIVSILDGVQLEPETEELELIASEQDHPEYALITSENVKRVIDDRETMEYLFDNELSDLKSTLYSIHSNAYNSALESEVWGEIWSELQTYFNGRGEWISKPHKYKKDTTVETFRIPVADNFNNKILDFLDANKNYGSSGLLEYHGSYLSLLDDYFDCLTAYSPDYPDSRQVDKNINEFFRDFL